MNSDLAKLSYRDLADRLGISADAARMKAKRKCKAGQWRIIPGNHPSDQVLVELPQADLFQRVGGERQRVVHPEQPSRTPPPEQPNERLLDALSEAVGLLRPAHDQIERLTAQLMEAKDAHARDRAELIAAEMRELGTKAELDRAIADLAMLQREVAELKKPWWRRR